MADLDVSNHSLNLSTSKQKYSFPRTKRFEGHEKPLYLITHAAATNYTPSPIPCPKEPLCSDTVIRQWGLITPHLRLALEVTPSITKSILRRI